jgi:tetratricopeptide (TPR) repeat protein
VKTELAREHAVEPVRRQEPAEFVWIEDELPSGARPQGDLPWRWSEKPAHPVYSGEKSSMRTADGTRQHYFVEARPPLRIGEGDRLFAYAYLPAGSLPKAIMLQWMTGRYFMDWNHRAFWGEDVIPFSGGTAGPHNFSMGPLPESGKWVRLEVAAEQVDLKPGDVISGWAFTQHGGTVYWDHAGIVTRTMQVTESQTAWEEYEREGISPGLPDAVRDALQKNSAQRSAAEAKVLRDYFVEYVCSRTRDLFDPLHRRLDEIEGRRWMGIALFEQYVATWMDKVPRPTRERLIEILSKSVAAVPANAIALERRGRLYASLAHDDESRREPALADLGLAAELFRDDSRAAAVAGLLAEVLLTESRSQWAILRPTQMKSEGDATLKELDDQSILVGGASPQKDTYTFVTQTQLSKITGIRLEALAHESLAQGGPGRNGNGNFALSEISVKVEPLAGGGQAANLKLINPHADYEQDSRSGDANRYPIAASLDGRSDSAWSILPQAGKDHAAVFEVDSSQQTGFEGGTKLTFTLECQSPYGQHTLGRFRLSLCGDQAVLEREKRRLAVRKVPDPWAKLAAAVSLTGDSARAAGYYGKAWDRAWDGKIKSEVIRTLAEDEPGLAALEVLRPLQRVDFEKFVAGAEVRSGKRDAARARYRQLAALQPDNPEWPARLAQLESGFDAAWNFDLDVEGWEPSSNCRATAEGGALRLETTGSDPFVRTRVSSPAGWKVVTIRVKSAQPEQLQLFWTTVSKPNESEDKTRTVRVKAGPDWQELKLVFQPDGPLASLRLDTENNRIGSRVEIDSIVLQTIDEQRALALIQPGNDPEEWLTSGRTHIAQKRPAQAAADLVRALDLFPSSDSWYAPRNKALAEFVASDEVFAELLKLRPDDTMLRICRGRGQVGENLWQRAMDEYERVIKSRPGGDEWFEYAALLLLNDDEPGYREFTEWAINKAGAKPEPFTAYALARMNSLVPRPVAEPARAIAWAKQAVDSGSTAWFVHALGLAHLRAGQWNEAVKQFEESNAAWGKPMNLLGMAIVDFRRNRTDAARARLNEAIEAFPTPGDGQWGPADRVEMYLLRREAEALAKKE